MGAITTAIIAGASAVGSAAATGAAAVGGAVASGAAAVGGALATGATTVGGAIASGAGTVGGAIAANPFQAIVAGAGLYGAERTYSAGREAEKLARREATAIQTETKEEIRRQKAQAAMEQGELRAQLGAGGLGASSLETFMAARAIEQSRDVNWMATSGRTRASMARGEGSVARRTSVAGAVGTLATTGSMWMQMNPGVAPRTTG